MLAPLLPDTSLSLLSCLSFGAPLWMTLIRENTVNYDRARTNHQNTIAQPFIEHSRH